jgi:hypothetical protein
VTAALLRDDAQLAALVAQLVRARELPPAPVTWFRVWAAAEHALRGGRDPGALFRWIVSGRRWSHLTAADDDAGAARVRAWRGRCAAPGAPRTPSPMRLADVQPVRAWAHHGPPAPPAVAENPTA